MNPKTYVRMAFTNDLHKNYFSSCFMNGGPMYADWYFYLWKSFINLKDKCLTPNHSQSH